ncbi:MAG: M15 family metallopeptidase [Pseudomonadota bacterium]
MSGFRFGTRSLQCLDGIHPDLVKVAHRALEISKVDFGIHCGMRTRLQQERLVAMGKSKTMNSRHLTGHAIDVHPWIEGDIPWNDQHPWRSVASAFKKAAKELGVDLEWGGDWARFIDMPHMQLSRSSYPA